jgi:outer membrane protein assembly factor BamB
VSVQHWLLVMDSIISSYEDAMKELKEDIGRYKEFFRALSLDVREAFRQKAAELAEMERERERLTRRAREHSDENLYLLLDIERKQKLQDMTLNLVRATVLILRKIQLSWAALSGLAADKSLQEEVLGQLSSQLRLYRDVLRFDRRMNQLQYEVSRFAQIAVRFDHIIADNIGPLHALIGEVAKVDEHIARSLNEMERLSFELSAQAGEAQVALGSALEAVLRHLVLSRVNQGIFDDAIRLMAQEDSATEELEYRTLEAEDDLLASIGSASRLVERQVYLLLGTEEEQRGAWELSTGPDERPAASAGTASGIRRLRVDLNTVLITSGLLSAVPCLHERSVYIGDEGGSFYRLEADTGSVHWRALLPAGINAAAAVYEGLCLVGSRNGQVFCLDSGSGERRWTFQTSGRIEAAPVVLAGRVFIGSLDGMMNCLEVESGSVCWQFAAGSAIGWEAALGEAVVYFAGSADCLFGVGSERGEQVLALRAGTSVVGAPVVAAGKLVFAGGDGRLYAFQAGSGEPAWTLEGRDGKLLPPVVFTEPSSGQEALAVQSSEGQLHVVSAAEGGIVSSMSTGARDPSFPPRILGSIACLQGELGTLEMMDLQTGRLLWSSKVSESPLLRPALSQDYVVAADRMGHIYLGAYGALEPVVE